MAEVLTRIYPPDVWRINADLHGFLTQIEYDIPRKARPKGDLLYLLHDLVKRFWHFGVYNCDDSRG